MAPLADRILVKPAEEENVRGRMSCCNSINGFSLQPTSTMLLQNRANVATALLQSPFSCR